MDFLTIRGCTGLLATGCGQPARGGGWIGGEVKQSGAVESCRLGAELPVLGSAMAVKPLALIWDLAQIDILTIRVLKCDIF